MPPVKMDTINKTMDRADLDRADCRLVLAELFGLMRRMKAAGAGYSSWYGAVGGWPSTWQHVNRGEGYEPFPGNPDELAVPWFLLWEIAWTVVNTPLRAGSRVLDMGGAGSLFSCYLASRGHEVVAIDLDQGLCDAANATGERMKWRLSGQRMDMQELVFPDAYFEHVFSICVFEHLPVSGRMACNRHVSRVLKPGGTVAFTFDYANPQSFGRLDTPDDVESQFVLPSGLSVRGNRRFADTEKRYLAPPQLFGFNRLTRLAARLHARLRRTVRLGGGLAGDGSYTIGALFMESGVVA